MNYKPYEYTYKATWKELEEYEVEKKVKSGDSYVTVTDANGDPVMVTKTRTVSSGTVTEKVTISGSAPFIKITDDTDWFKRSHATLTTAGGVYSTTFGFDSGVSYTNYIFPGSDINRTSYSQYSASFVSYVDDNIDSAQEAADHIAAKVANPSVFDFWTNPTEDWLKANGNTIKHNGTIGGENSCASGSPNKIPAEALNKSSGDSYSSSGYLHFKSLRKGGSTTGGAFSVNSVRVHTPIANELLIVPENKNQLENTTLANGCPIATLGDNVKVTVSVIGPDSYYYNDNIAKRLTDLSKYVREVRLECGLCGGSFSYKRDGTSNTLTKENGGRDYVHQCTVPITKKDNTTYPIKSIVIAENSPSSQYLDGITDDSHKNEPDDIYVLKRESGVYVAGKMYELEVRATDDPGWKDFVGKAAQKLNTLPVGEKGDNAASAYKYGIKLGYRAYFDLKTLGVATKDVTITPKIYYIKPDGTVVTDFDMYYKTSSTTYKQIMDNGVIKDANDIKINMTMNTTYGDKYNSAFSAEKLNTLNALKNIGKAVNYASLDNIGGLKKISLDSETTATNALMTMYNGSYITTPDFTNSRRWYGEVYVPASTVVAEKDSTIEGIARGLKTYTKGYLLVTFDTIQTTTREGEQYLKYSTANNPSGVENRPYILINEKAGKGKTVPITLPNGKQINIAGLGTDFYETSAPIIIYDVSLRANNDYEASGTH